MQLDPKPSFDLVIVDEAHRIRNTETYAHKAIKFLIENSDAALFLTATPIQLGEDDLFNLLNVLRPDYIIDQTSFNELTQPNTFINRAVNIVREKSHEWNNRASDELINTLDTEWGNRIFPNDETFKDITNRLNNSSISDEERIALMHDIEQLHTLSDLINRTRRLMSPLVHFVPFNDIVEYFFFTS